MDTCAICLIIISNKVSCPLQKKGVNIGGCGHRFHLLCIREWMAVRNNCPQCRNDQNRDGN